MVSFAHADYLLPARNIEPGHRIIVGGANESFSVVGR